MPSGGRRPPQVTSCPAAVQARAKCPPIKPLAPAIITRTDNTSGKPLSADDAKYGRLRHGRRKGIDETGARDGRRRERTVHGGSRAVRPGRESQSRGAYQRPEPVDIRATRGAGAQAESAPYLDRRSDSPCDGDRMGIVARASLWAPRAQT